MNGEQLSSTPIDVLVSETHADARLDWFLAQQFPAYSRVMLRKVINAAGVKVDGLRVKAAYRLQPGQRVTIVLPELAREGPRPENIPLDILYEDDVLAAVNKPPCSALIRCARYSTLVLFQSGWRMAAGVTKASTTII